MRIDARRHAAVAAIDVIDQGGCPARGQAIERSLQPQTQRVQVSQRGVGMGRVDARGRRRRCAVELSEPFGDRHNTWRAQIVRRGLLYRSRLARHRGRWNGCAGAAERGDRARIQARSCSATRNRHMRRTTVAAADAFACEQGRHGPKQAEPCCKYHCQPMPHSNSNRPFVCDDWF